MDTAQNSQDNGIKGFICINGNDGSGKSSICHLLNQNFTECQSKGFFCIERSMLRASNIQNLSYYSFIQKHQQNITNLIGFLKKFDLLTYSYSFENDWYNFDIPTSIDINGKNIPIYWIFLEVPSHILKSRISHRLQMTIYQHNKCIEYFNTVYREMCYFYGIPLVPNYNRGIKDTVQEIYSVIGNNISSKTMPSLKDLTPDNILNNQIQLKIQEQINEWKQKEKQELYQNIILPEIKSGPMNDFYGGHLDSIEENLKTKIICKWIKNNCKRVQNEQSISLQLPNSQKTVTILTKQGQFLFQEIIQGESKIIFRLISPFSLAKRPEYTGKIFILLKGTIYSHTKQSSGEIKELPQIRAKGSMIFLQMLKRNHIKHSYICINKSGVILSELVETNDLEIVFKKQLLGTDKHSYLGINKHKQICLKKQNSVEYSGGIYIRFDWRNPNHILITNPDIILNQDPYYYIIEKHLSKQKFFEIFLSDKQKCKPIGDKCVTEDVIAEYTNTDKIKEIIIGAYCTFQYYSKQVGLQILDGCFMVDHGKSQMIWSEINPDCLRVKSISKEIGQNKQREHYDKDLWRIGGSASKELIVQKWKMFNQIFMSYFQSHRFMDAEFKDERLCKQIYARELIQESKIRPKYQKYYENLVRGKKRREIIGTIDIINGEPILVQESIFKQKHSQGKLKDAWDYIKIMPQIVIVDIDGASGKETDNRKLITELSRLKPNNIYGVGGGIRDSKKAEHFLSCVGNIIISSNLDIIKEFSRQICSHIIVELSINQKNQVLVHARTVNTQQDVIQKITELCNYGIKTISITFRNSQGKLEGIPKNQLRDIMYRMPGPIEKVIIAGGISSLEDLQFIWGFNKCVPQLGSAIWKKKISIGQIYSKIVRYDKDGLINAVIKDKNDKVLGVVYLNQQAILRTCQERVLYRYSREHQKIMKKGETSGNIQQIQSMNIDCDNDSLLITVVPQGAQLFCHFNQQSCFYQNSLENQRKDIVSLQQHILKSIKQGVGSGYAYKMQNKPQLAIEKAIEQIQELSLAQNSQLQLQESADFLAHIIMFWNSQGIKINDILGILNQRSRKKITRAVYSEKVAKSDPMKKQIRIGIALGKHTKFIHDFMRQKIGIQLQESKEKSRCYKIEYSVVDKEKLTNILSLELTPEIQIILVSTKPKDMAKMMNKKFIDFGINYSNMLSQYCDDIEFISSMKVENLKLALIKRRNQNVRPEQWQNNRKGLIASQYPYEVVKYMANKEITSDRYTLLKVTGHSESYLSDFRFDYCDAIVNSGKTIQENNLQIQAVLVDQINVVLFKI